MSELNAFFQNTGIREAMKRSIPPETFQAWLVGQMLFHSIKAAQSGDRQSVALTLRYADQVLGMIDGEATYPQ